MAKHIYVATRGSGLKFTAVYKGEKTDKDIRAIVKFENGQFKTDDDQLANAIDELIECNTNIRSHCKKADKEAAEKMAIAHRALQQKTGAHKGGFSTDAAKAAMGIEMQQRDATLKHEGVDKVAVAKDESLILTEKGVTHPSPELAKIAEAAEKSVVGNVLNLGSKS